MQQKWLLLPVVVARALSTHLGPPLISTFAMPVWLMPNTSQERCLRHVTFEPIQSGRLKGLSVRLVSGLRKINYLKTRSEYISREYVDIQYN